MPRIFISYRRDDSIAHAGRISDHLVSRFGKNNVFMDIDTLEPGVDFAEELKRRVAACDVFLAIIGKQWLTVNDEAGRPRIEDPQDFVALEIATALARRNIRVVPVLVGGARMPKAKELPERLAGLSARHALVLMDIGFQQALSRFIESIDRAEPGPGPNPEPHPGRSALTVAVVALASVGLATLIARTSGFQTISLQSQDTHFLLRGETPTSGIVLLAVDEKSSKALPEPLVEWRKYYAKAITASAKAGAKSLGLLAVLAKPLADRKQDRVLRDAAESANPSMPVVYAFIDSKDKTASDEFWSVPMAEWAEERNRLGFANPYTDQDNFIRRWQLMGEPTIAGVSPSFALLTAAVSRGVNWRASEGRLFLGDELIPVDRRRALRINYPGGPNVFPRVPLSDFIGAVDRGEAGRIRDWVAGKTVLIGYDFPRDRLATPFYSRWRSPQPDQPPNTAAVEVQAAAIHTLLTGRYILDAPPGIAIAAMFVAAAMTAAIVWWLPVAGAAIGLVSVVLAILLGTQLLFRSGRMLAPAEILLPGFLALIGTLFCRSQLAERVAQTFKRAIRLFVGQEALTPIEANGRIQPGGVTQVVSILFSDIRDFTAFCAGKTPVEVAQMQNEYRSGMTPIISRHEGRVDKFLGDGILAIFTGNEHARRAIDCGLEMVRFPFSLKTGVGIHSGEAMVGLVGSEDRMEYTAMGDTVNLASRLESLNKEYKTRLIFSESTRAMLPETMRTVGLGDAQIRGRNEPMAIYTLAELQPEAALKGVSA